MVEQDLKTSVKGQILSIKDLPTLPKVLDEVSRLVQDPNANTDEIAKIISRDQVLSAKVLKMVNSPVYGFPGRIGTVQHALVLLGFNVVRGIIISTSVFEMMVKAMEGLWEHSLGCALAANVVAKHAGLADPEEFSVAGLLHDLGKVVGAVQLPELHEAVAAAVREQDLRWFEAERAVIREGMSHHHSPETAQLYPETAAVVHVADFIVRVYEFGTGGDDQAAPLSRKALEVLKLKLPDLDRVLDEFAVQLADVSDLDLA